MRAKITSGVFCVFSVITDVFWTEEMLNTQSNVQMCSRALDVKLNKLIMPNCLSQ